VTLTFPSGYENSQTMVDPPRFFSAQEGVLPVRLFTPDRAGQVFYNTQDGGQSWTAGAPVESLGAYSIANGHNLFVWDGGILYRSQDGGLIWEGVQPDINLIDILASLDFVDANNGWALSSDADGQTQLYRTIDGGQTWAPVP